MQKQDLGFRCARRCRTGMLCPQSTRAQTQPCMGTSQGRCKFPRKHHCFQATCLARTGISPLVPHLGSRAWPVWPHLSARCDGAVIHGGGTEPLRTEKPPHPARAGLGTRHSRCTPARGLGWGHGSCPAWPDRAGGRRWMRDFGVQDAGCWVRDVDMGAGAGQGGRHRTWDAGCGCRILDAG